MSAPQWPDVDATRLGARLMAMRTELDELAWAAWRARGRTTPVTHATDRGVVSR